MTSKILIDATHHHEVRVAIIEGQKLTHYDYDSLENQHKKGCIYKGIVSRIEPSLNAAFVDYGAQRHGFLPASEVSSLLYPNNISSSEKPTIQDLLTKGQEIIVQIDKDEIGNKGAALTTNISIAGCYIVLMPMTENAGGISRQIEGEDRDHLMRLINQMDIPETYSIIMRTASIGRSLDELLWDFNVLKSQWEAMNLCAQDSKEPVLLYQEGAILSRVIRDYLKPSVSEILIDDKYVYEEVLKLVQHIRPDFLSVVKFFDKKNTSVFAYYGIEPLIESLFNSYVVLENGATLVIDHREALTSIDINSARSTSGNNIETTAFQTNLAAAKEIARQICLRNIGGQIVIDFIDMSSAEECRQVEEALKNALSHDKARHQFCKISRLGLLQMSRQRLKTSIDAEQLMTCANCHGHGKHRKPRPVALSILRLIEQESFQHPGHSFDVEIHPQIAEFLFNEYRHELCAIEKKAQTVIKIKTSLDASNGDYLIHVLNDGKVIKKLSNNPFANQAEQEQQQEKSNASKPQHAHLLALSPPNPRGVTWLQKLWGIFSPLVKEATASMTKVTQAVVAPALPAPSSNNRPEKSHNNNNKKRRQNNNQQHQKNFDHRNHRAESNQEQTERRNHPTQQHDHKVESQEPRKKQPEQRPSKKVVKDVKEEVSAAVVHQEPVKATPAKRTHRPLSKAEVLPPANEPEPVVIAAVNPAVEAPAVEQQNEQPGADARQTKVGHPRRRRSRNRKPAAAAPSQNQTEQPSE